MQETTKYQKEWEEYKDERAVGFVFVLIGIPIFAGIIYFSRNYPQFSKYTQIILPIVFVILFLSALFLNFTATVGNFRVVKRIFAREKVLVRQLVEIV